MLPTNPTVNFKHTWFHRLTATILIIILGIAVSEMRLRPPVPGFEEAMAAAIESRECDGLPVLTRYTGIKAIDLGLQVLVTVFLPGAAGYDKGYQILQIYFLVAFFAVISIWCVESGRMSNRSSLIRFPAIWSLFYQTVGGAIIIPLYYLVHLYSTRNQDFSSPDVAVIPTGFAKALAPSLVIGYLLPTISMYLPSLDNVVRQRLVAFWQPCPLLVGLLLQLLPRMSSVQSSRIGSLKHLNRTYAVVFITSTILHIGTILYLLTSEDPEASFTRAFDPRVSYPASPLVVGIKYIFQIDFWGIFAASLVWAYLAIYDMKLADRTDISMIQAFIYFAVGTVVSGPAAVLAATWYWREQLLARSHKSR